MDYRDRTLTEEGKTGQGKWNAKKTKRLSPERLKSMKKRFAHDLNGGSRQSTAETLNVLLNAEGDAIGQVLICFA